jgi:hypothetical protein
MNNYACQQITTLYFASLGSNNVVGLLHHPNNEETNSHLLRYVCLPSRQFDASLFMDLAQLP